jgi:hypothetical protein
MSSPTTVLVAGMPRSGSTWQFNAVRLLLEDAGLPHWAGWIDDLPEELDVPLRLVKVHQPSDAPGAPDMIFTTLRPIADCLVSLIRMGWLTPEPEAVRRAYAGQLALRDHWAPLSVHTTRFETLLKEPEAEVAALARVLGRLPVWVDRSPPSPKAAARVSRKLATLRAPHAAQGDTPGYDPVTLMHPGHRGEMPARLAAEVAEWLRDQR